MRYNGDTERYEAYLTKRELATVLAALRHWQASDVYNIDLLDISTDGGTLEALTAAEIDDLCEELN